VTAVVMFALAAGKARSGQALGNPVLRTEGRVTLIDGILATAVLLGLVLNAVLGWWWADPAAGYVLVCYAAREVWEIFSAGPGHQLAPAQLIQVRLPGSPDGGRPGARVRLGVVQAAARAGRVVSPGRGSLSRA
jgi:hypothetical protein